MRRQICLCSCPTPGNHGRHDQPCIIHGILQFDHIQVGRLNNEDHKAAKGDKQRGIAISPTGTLIRSVSEVPARSSGNLELSPITSLGLPVSSSRGASDSLSDTLRKHSSEKMLQSMHQPMKNFEFATNDQPVSLSELSRQYNKKDPKGLTAQVLQHMHVGSANSANYNGSTAVLPAGSISTISRSDLNSKAASGSNLTMTGIHNFQAVSREDLLKCQKDLRAVSSWNLGDESSSQAEHSLLSLSSIMLPTHCELQWQPGTRISETTNKTRSSTGSRTNKHSPAVAKELQRMKKKIEELSAKIPKGTS